MFEQELQIELSQKSARREEIQSLVYQGDQDALQEAVGLDNRIVKLNDILAQRAEEERQRRSLQRLE